MRLILYDLETSVLFLGKLTSNSIHGHIGKSRTEVRCPKVSCNRKVRDFIQLGFDLCPSHIGIQLRQLFL